MTTTYSESLDASVKAAQDAARASYANKPQLEDLAAQAAASQAAAESASANASSAASDASAAQASAAASAALVGAPADSAISAVLSAPGSASRAVLDSTYARPSVVMFGAGIDPTGTADSTAAIQAKLNAAPVGADIHFPAGTFLVNNLTINVAGLRVVGRGRKASILRRNATGVLFQVNAADVTLEGLRFDGQGATYGGGQPLLATSAATGLVVDSCTVEGASGSSPHAVTASGDGFAIRNSRIYGDVQILNADNGMIDGNRFYPPSVTAAAFGVTVAALIASTGTADNCRVVNNYFEIPTDRFAISPLSRNGAVRPRGTIIANNVMIAVGDAYGGISIDTCNGGSITGNVFRIASGVPKIAPLEIVATDRVTATGNFLDCGAVLDGPAISANTANDCTISGNVVLSGTLTGSENVISIIAPAGTSSSRNVVTGNKVITTSSTDAYGIGLSCLGNGVIASTIISGNHINNSGSDARGIRLAAGSSGGSITNTLIDGNIIENGTFGFYFNNDVGTALVNNRTVGTVTTRIGVSTGGATGGTNIQLSGNSWQTATAAPTTQYHFAGERVTNSAPAVGSPQGWVCTASGTPGTWVAMANL